MILTKAQKVRQAALAWRTANPRQYQESLREYHRRWRNAHPDYFKQWQIDNRDYVTQRKREYRARKKPDAP